MAREGSASLPGGSGEVEIPRGRSIESLSVAPDGRHIAFSLESRLSIGEIDSAVVLLRSADGQELYRRYHPQFTRTHLAFLGNDHLAVRNYEDGPKGTSVYSVID